MGGKSSADRAFAAHLQYEETEYGGRMPAADAGRVCSEWTVDLLCFIAGRQLL